MPRVWTDPPPGIALERDGNEAVKDQNTLMTPRFPLLAMVASVRAYRPNFAFNEVNIVTTRNSLRKLLRFIRGSERPGAVADFRIDVDVTGKTMLLTRRELRTVEHYKSRSMRVAQSFERVCTLPADGDYATHMSHHRVVKYVRVVDTFPAFPRDC